MKQRMACAVFAALAAAACASGPVTTSAATPELYETSPGVYLRVGREHLGTSSEISAPAGGIWNALPDAYSTFGITGAGVINAQTRLYGAPAFTASRIGRRRTDTYVRCGFQGAGPSAATAFRTRLSIVSQVSPSSDTTATLTTQVTGNARPVEGTSSELVRCVSNGQIEKEIARLVSESVNR